MIWSERYIRFKAAKQRTVGKRKWPGEDKILESGIRYNGT